MVEEAGVGVARADWYPDPTGRHEHRYWDGSHWTVHVADRGVASADPIESAPPVVDERADRQSVRAEDITGRLEAIEVELTSVRARMRRAMESPSDAPGGDMLIASVMEKLGQRPTGDLAGAPTLGQVEALEQERTALEAELARLRGAPDAGEGTPTGVTYTSVDPDRTRRALELREHYVAGEHPMDATMRTLGVTPTRPVYRVVDGRVARGGQPGIDMKIISVASCLPGEDVEVHDATRSAELALQAIQHYASLPQVQAFFLLPYRLRTGEVVEGSAVPAEEECAVCAGVENLLLEIYDELPAGATITDDVVERKIEQLVASCA